MPVTGQQIGSALCDALGLPKHTRGFTLRCYTGEAVTVECEYYPDIDKGSITLAMAEYELMRKDAPAQVEPIHFEAWMRERTERAHAAYMAQHSCGGIEYAKRGPWPPAIPARSPRNKVDASIEHLDAHNLT